MIALAIAGLGLVALFQAAQSGIRTVAVAEHTQEAISRAQSRLAATEVALHEGEQSGDDGGGYRYRVTVAPPSGQDRRGAGPPLYAVTVAVGWSMDGAPREVSLSTWRLGMAGGLDRAFEQ